MSVKRKPSLVNISGEPNSNKAKQINGYLIDAPLVFFDKTRNQYSDEARMDYGCKVNDGGNLLLNRVEHDDLIANEPLAKKYIRPFIGSQEFLNNIERWCLWFYDYDPVALNKDLEKMPLVRKRLENIKELRLASRAKTTHKLAETPHLFESERQPRDGDYLLIPSISSENRRYIPIGFLNSETVCSNLAFTLPNANLYHFGVLSSNMHNSFMRLTAGRMKSDYRYSNTIVYNNFQYPFMAQDDSSKTLKIKKDIEIAAQNVLNARKLYQDGSDDAPTLAKLYNTYMINPYPELTKAHTTLDKAVDKAYGYRGDGSDTHRTEFLLKRLAEV